jgi:apolipoprotein N-acyltransferase
MVNGLGLYPMFWDVLPLTWLNASESPYQTAFVAVSWAFSAAAMGSVFIFFALGVRFFATHSWKDLLFFPSFWVLTEVAASLIGNSINYGKGNFVGFDWTINMLGYQLSQDPALLQFARIGGVFILSGVVVFLGAVAYRALFANTLREREILRMVLAICMFAWIGGHFYIIQLPRINTKAPTNRFAIIATDLHNPKYDAIQNLNIQMPLVEAASSSDIVVLPEASELFYKLQQFDIPRPHDASMYIDSAEVTGDDGFLRTRADYYDPAAKTDSYSYKHFLIPMGEYIPYLYIKAAEVLGYGKTLSFRQLINYRQHLPGNSQVVTSSSGAILGALFCNESLSPTLYRSLTVQGATVLVNMASQLWFNGSRRVFAQLQHATQVRAVENDRWLVQADNVAPAYVVDNYGRIAAQTAWGTQGAVIFYDVPLLSHMTLYSRAGLWVLLVPLVCLLWACVGVRQRFPAIISMVKEWVIPSEKQRKQ